MSNYTQEYNKKHYKQLKVQLKPDEMKQLDEQLKRLNISKVQFIRDAIKDLINKR